MLIKRASAVGVCRLFFFFNLPFSCTSTQCGFHWRESVPSLRGCLRFLFICLLKKKASGICVQTLMNHLKYSQCCASVTSSYEKKTRWKGADRPQRTAFQA